MPEPSALRIETVPLTHPDAARLIEEVQEEYVVRYGGRDDTPMDVTEFEGEKGRFYVGYDNGVPVVTGAWRWHEPIADAPAPSVEIKRMYVAKTHRGRGLARVMLAHLETTGAAAGARSIILETGLAQPEAIALYESSGYHPVPGFGFYRDAPLNRCFAKPL
ncbi:MAG TPA: GNAT family N-acetyltransferase [Nocardioides sp.]